MHEFRKLRVYKQALQLTKVILAATKCFPKEELYALTAQLRKACYSIVLNIAEGAGRGSNRDFCRFLDYALGSSYECMACLDIALTNEYVVQEEYDRLYAALDTINSMLVGLRRSIASESSVHSDDR